MVDNKLKPCPFCGSAAEIHFFQDESLWSHNIVWWSSISCTKCDITMNECEDEKGLKIKNAWNRRIKDD